MQVKNIIFLLVGLLLDAFGSLILLGSFLQYNDGELKSAEMILVVLFGVVPLVLGTWMTITAIRRHQQGAGESLEREILQLASTRGGALTPQIVAVETKMSMQQAKAKLDEMHANGFCRLDLQDDGDLIYRFAGLDA